jgi:hypothetical protein
MLYCVTLLSVKCCVMTAVVKGLHYNSSYSCCTSSVSNVSDVSDRRGLTRSALTSMCSASIDHLVFTTTSSLYYCYYRLHSLLTSVLTGEIGLLNRQQAEIRQRSAELKKAANDAKDRLAALDLGTKEAAVERERLQVHATNLYYLQQFSYYCVASQLALTCTTASAVAGTAAASSTATATAATADNDSNAGATAGAVEASVGEADAVLQSATSAIADLST